MEMAIKSIQLPSQVAVSNAAAALKRNRTAVEANSKVRRVYAEELKKVEEATKGVWSDWQECREKHQKAKKIQATREEYARLCDGNAELAETFLAKVYDQDTIEAAAVFIDNAEFVQHGELLLSE